MESRTRRPARRNKLDPIGAGREAQGGHGVSPPPPPPLQGGKLPTRALLPSLGSAGGQSRTTTPRAGTGSGQATAEGAERKRRGRGRRNSDRDNDNSEAGNEDEPSDVKDAVDEEPDDNDFGDRNHNTGQQDEEDMNDSQRPEDNSRVHRDVDDYDIDPKDYDADGVIAMDMDDIIDESNLPDRANRTLIARETTNTAFAAPVHFYENVFTGAFDRVTVAKAKAEVESLDPQHEQLLMRSGVELVLYLDSTIGLAARGLTAGMSMNTLSATYFRCSVNSFAYCYMLSSGHILHLLFFLLNVVVLVAAIQCGNVRPTDPRFHFPLVIGTFTCYAVAFLSSVIAGPVDDQMFLYGQTTDESLAISVPQLGKRFVTEQLWHVLNVVRFSALIIGWIFTCIDRVYMTIQMRVSGRNRTRGHVEL